MDNYIHRNYCLWFQEKITIINSPGGQVRGLLKLQRYSVHSRRKYTQVVYGETKLLTMQAIGVGGRPGDFEILTKGVFVESEVQSNKNGCDVSQWHSREMHRILVNLGSVLHRMCPITWLPSPQQRPGLQCPPLCGRNLSRSLLLLWCFCDVITYVAQYLKRATSKRTSN